MLKFSLVAPTSLLFIEIQWNGLLRAKGVVILDTEHHLTSHPTDIQDRNIKNSQQLENSFIIFKKTKETQLYIQCIKETRQEHQSIQHREPDCSHYFSDLIKAHYTFDFA